VVILPKIEIIFEVSAEYAVYTEILSNLIDKRRKLLYNSYSEPVLAGSFFVKVKKEDP
jgi:hypothetical protein